MVKNRKIEISRKRKRDRGWECVFSKCVLFLCGLTQTGKVIEESQINPLRIVGEPFSRGRSNINIIYLFTDLFIYIGINI